MSPARPGLAQLWMDTIANYSLTAMLSVQSITEQAPIDAGITYGPYFNSSGGFVIAKPSMTKKIPQVAGSCAHHLLVPTVIIALQAKGAHL